MPKQSPSPPPSTRDQKPLLIVISGPSGVGKDAVLARMKERGMPYYYVVTVTTRLPRSMEKDGIDYHFVSQERFLKMKENNELLEHAHVYGNWYGVPRKEVTDALEAGKDTVIKVDVQGVEHIKQVMPQAIAIFLSPPSREDLETRLKQRSTESADILKLRVKSAENEFDKLPIFDYVVINHWNEVDRAVEEIAAIIDAEKCHPLNKEVAPGS